MAEVQKNTPDEKNSSDRVIPASAPEKPADPDEEARELPDLEPEIPADPDDFIHTFPPEREITNADDIDDVIHPPAIDGGEPE